MKANEASPNAVKRERKAPAQRKTPDREGRAANQRLSKEAREQQIVQKAIQLFAERGFSVSTHEIARELGITQPLLYNYFPTKEALVDRVYDEVFVRKWDPLWEEWLGDASKSLSDRLKRYLKDYAQYILRSDWIRIFISAGLTRQGINQRYIARLREHHFKVIAREMRKAYAIPEPLNEDELEDEIELIWSMHSGVFYIGMRKWVYALTVPKDLDRVIDMRVDAFLLGAPQILKAAREASRARKPVPSKQSAAFVDSGSESASSSLGASAPRLDQSLRKD
ncbi:MAG: HTH-type transcriptional regulator LuxR [Paracidovorax wautersii]|uniref:HTH-type transcriptional regulator LuxR n=1 Tax=Paracidovorax wautersii TaxID=1177982 RepID=A0A7V8JPH0_9BURK|nr:MAG: HTH-type transcriptional regulator LuxR [Paracidovorax wautersii]